MNRYRIWAPNRFAATLTAAVVLTLAACASDPGGTSIDTPAPSPATETEGATTTTPAPAATTTTTSTTTTTLATAATTSTTTTTVAAADEPLTVQELLDLGRPIVLAHAAGEDEFPHSSPFGYGQSVAAGVDVLDFDVQLTGDGVLVVQHDDTTGRTADKDLVVAASTYDELMALDNAYWFTAQGTNHDQPADAYIYRGIRTGDVPPPAGYTPDDFAIARFRDIAERFSNFPVNIEIKGTGEPAIAAAKQLAVELTELDLLDNAVVASFDDTVVDAFRTFAPSVEVSPGLNASSAFILNDVALLAGMRILQLPVKFGEIEVLSQANIDKAHAAGYVIWVWPDDHDLENLDGYQHLLEMGLDGLNINYPAAGVAAVEAFTLLMPAS